MIVDINDQSLNFNPSPCVISRSTKLNKIHFLFIQLGIDKIYVTENQILMGVI